MKVFHLIGPEALKKSFRKRLLLSMFVISVLPLVLISFVASILLQNAFRQQYTDNHISTLFTMDSYIRIIEENIDRSCRLVLSNDTVQSVLSDPGGISWSNILLFDKAIPSILYDNPDLLNISIIDMNGNLYTCGRDHNSYIVSVDMEAISEQNWYKRTLEANGQIIYADGDVALQARDSTISCCKLLNRLEFSQDSEKNSIGIMVMQISKDVLFSCLSAAETGEIYCVLDDENQLLYATGDYTLLQALEDVQFDDTQLKGYFSSSIVSKSIPWKIMNVIYNSQLYAASDLLVSLIARFTLLLGLLVMVLFVFLQRSLYRPLKELECSIMEASEQTATSKQLHLHAFGIDEIGQIGRKFNEMLIRNQILSERIVAESVKQKEAELSNLQAMINPHFLYNTLDCIYWNACINKDMDVANMALALSRIMRNSLNQGKFLSTVEQEFQLIESYLFIQKCRHKETLQHEVILDERLKKNKILKLILQPFVENAVLHGLEPKVGHGRIKVEGKLVGDEMVFTIWDDGVGMDAATLGKPGYGITNVKKRLELFYQGRYSLQIQSIPKHGTTVEIRLDARVQEMKEGER